MALFRKGRTEDDIVLPDGEVVEVPGEELGDETDFVEEDWEGLPTGGEEEFDPRADGPFDIDEVDLNDGVQRLDLGALILTPVSGFSVKLVANQETKEVQAATVTWGKSGLEIALFAASTTGGSLDEVVAEITEQTEAADGSIEFEDGPFGQQLKRIVPVPGTGKEQLFHVSRIWLVEGPRWLLRGTVLGEAAISDDETLAEPFAEFLRNIVVRRGNTPMAPGDLIPLTLPEK
ncbi:MAG: DUF3710 domain-containing protein [Propionibacteriaceae bacterium]|jgi:hypothetical protein|nr:DUF3710 domain-containing protein [Propionibacteriaceae bacterium]